FRFQGKELVVGDLFRLAELPPQRRHGLHDHLPRTGESARKIVVSDRQGQALSSKGGVLQEQEAGLLPVLRREQVAQVELGDETVGRYTSQQQVFDLLFVVRVRPVVAAQGEQRQVTGLFTAPVPIILCFRLHEPSFFGQGILRNGVELVGERGFPGVSAERQGNGNEHEERHPGRCISCPLSSPAWFAGGHRLVQSFRVVRGEERLLVLKPVREMTLILLPAHFVGGGASAT